MTFAARGETLSPATINARTRSVGSPVEYNSPRPGEGSLPRPANRRDHFALRVDGCNGPAPAGSAPIDSEGDVPEYSGFKMACSGVGGAARDRGGGVQLPGHGDPPSPQNAHQPVLALGGFLPRPADREGVGLPTLRRAGRGVFRARRRVSQLLAAAGQDRVPLLRRRLAMADRHPDQQDRPAGHRSPRRAQGRHGRHLHPGERPLPRRAVLQEDRDLAHRPRRLGPGRPARGHGDLLPQPARHPGPWKSTGPRPNSTGRSSGAPPDPSATTPDTSTAISAPPASRHPAASPP